MPDATGYFIIKVIVQPKSTRDEITGYENETLRVRVTSPPQQGRANERLREVIAREFKIPKSQVKILKGEKTRIKKILIQGITEDLFKSHIAKIAKQP